MNNNVLSNNINSIFKKNFNVRYISINFGPQHPAAHGVLRLILKLNSEVILDCDPHIGLLHRGTEKLMESKNFLHNLPYFDRLDYVSTIVQESVYSIAIDKLLNIKQQSIILVNRTVFDELTRVLNHLLAVSCHALDVGSMSTIFWSFEEREKIMEFFERISGARMHTALYKPLRMFRNINKQMCFDILSFSNELFITLNEIHNVLTNNKVWKTRLLNIGVVSYRNIQLYGITGVMSRSTGLKRDIRLNKYTSYNNYKYLNFYSFITNNGDSYDRYLLRMYEMIESVNIIQQSIIKIKKKVFLKNKKLYNINYNNLMESIIDNFKYSSLLLILDNF